MRRTSILVALLGFCAACSGRESNSAADGQTATNLSSADGSGSAATDSASAAPTEIGAGSGSRNGVDYYGREMLSRIAASLSKGNDPTRTFGRHPALWYVAARRTVSGSAEVHDKWIDVTFVQAGRATFLSGGTVTGSHLQGAGEHRGGTIRGGTRRTLGSGDFFVIPAGIPHQLQLSPGDSLLYLTVKVLDQTKAR